MRVKVKDGASGSAEAANSTSKTVHSQAASTKPASASNATGSDTVPRQMSLDADDTNIDFMDMFNDPSFMSSMMQAYPNAAAYQQAYPQGLYGASTSNPMQYNDQYSQFQNANFFPLLYEDDDDDDDEYSNFLMNMAGKPFSGKVTPMQNFAPTSKPKSQLEGKTVKNTTAPKVPPNISAASSAALSPRSGVVSPSSSVSLGNLELPENVDDNSGVQSQKSNAVIISLPQAKNSDVSQGSLNKGTNAQKQIATLHSYSLPSATPDSLSGTIRSGSISTLLPNQNVIQTIVPIDDGSLTRDNSVSSQLLVSTAVTIPNIPLALDTIAAPESVLMMPSTTPVVVTSQISTASYNTSPDSANPSLSTSPLPSDILMQSASVKGRAKSTAKRSKASKVEHSPKNSSPSASKRRRAKEEPEPTGISFTPVETITDIVGVDPKVAEQDEHLKDIVLKPIKHQTEINVESAHNRSVKNAINARMNRQKHKQFVQSLEDENSTLKDRIQDLETFTEVLKTEKDVLKQEIRYLKSVIANESSISNVLNNLSGIKEVRLSSGFAKNNRKRAADSTVHVHEPNDSKRATLHATSHGEETFVTDGSDVTSGVCLHVHDDSVSVEFCSQCASMAAEGRS